jgi:hypothetical protein
MITLYLAGAIRDAQVSDDVAWREYLIDKIHSHYMLDVGILNPVGNKTFNPTTKKWLVGGIPTQAHGIVQQDLWCVRHADIIIANVTSLASGYPSIGTIMEMGAAVGMGGKLIYTIMDPTGQAGNANPGVFRIHPFLQEVSTEVFESVESLWAFLGTHLGMLTGTKPSFGGYAHE